MGDDARLGATVGFVSGPVALLTRLITVGHVEAIGAALQRLLAAVLTTRAPCLCVQRHQQPL
jgi:hypothetical protein